MPDMRVVCAWCGRHMRGPQDAPPERTSHSICDSCARKMELDAALEACKQVAQKMEGK